MSKDEGGNVTSYTYDNGDRMLTAGGVGYAYDNNGNQTGRGADTFGWDYENRLISATVNGTSVSYTYRGDGLRHSKTVGSNTISLRAEALEAEAYTWDVNSGLPVVLQDGAYTYVYGLGLISQTDNSGNQSYFLGNGLGSTEALVDGSGNVIATYKYDVYGAVRSSSGSGSTEYRFTGQQDDADIGYTYLRARYYDPQTLHSYLYTAADPINAVDPSGKAKCLGRFWRWRSNLPPGFGNTCNDLVPGLCKRRCKLGLTVALQTEEGKRLREIGDPTNELASLLPPITDRSYHLLRFIDPYGDTVFNRLQMDQSLDEWQRVCKRATTTQQHRLVAEIEELAELCRREPHLYLKFIGD